MYMYETKIWYHIRQLFHLVPPSLVINFKISSARLGALTFISPRVRSHACNLQSPPPEYRVDPWRLKRNTITSVWLHLSLSHDQSHDLQERTNQWKHTWTQRKLK